jgi:hypothetical protein
VVFMWSSRGAAVSRNAGRDQARRTCPESVDDVSVEYEDVEGISVATTARIRRSVSGSAVEVEIGRGRVQGEAPEL